MTWGMPPPPFDFTRRDEKPRHSFFLRELWSAEKELFQPAHRCLIILDSFALPDGPAGARTRTWHGYDGRPIFGWAGLWREGRDTRGYAGFVVETMPEVEPRRTVPAIVEPEEYETWLTGETGPASRIVSRLHSGEGLYCEPTEQPWGADTTP